MSRYQLLPLPSVRRSRLCFIHIFASLLIIATAVNSQGQTPAATPVARLVTASRDVPTLPMPSGMVRGLTITGEMSAPSLDDAKSLERRAFELINERRRASGEEPLSWDGELCRMARLHSESMASRNFFSHVGPDKMDVATRARASGIEGWRALGENIAYNQGFDDPAASAVEQWMRSAKHRANILRAEFTRTGIGIARSADGRIFFTQVFIAR